MIQQVGSDPDSIAISPDGKYAVIACEAERDPDSPGAVWVVDLSSLAIDHSPRDGELPGWEVPGLDILLGKPKCDFQPEFVSFDPQSRFAVISCQENDLVLTLDLRGKTPAFGKPIYLIGGSEPDGVAVLDHVKGPDGRIGCMVAVAEEGKLSGYGQIQGHCLSFHWLDPDHLDVDADFFTRLDVRQLTNPAQPNARRDPEAIKLLRFAGRTIAVATTERGGYFLVLDITDPTHSALIDKCKVGDRPEGLILIPNNDDLIAVTGDEGGYGPGTVCFVRLRAKP